MEIHVLKAFRFFAPFIVFLVLFAMYGIVTERFDVTFPDNVKDAVWGIGPVIACFLYQALPARSIANQFYFSKVNENLRNKLVKIGNAGEDDKRVDWPAARKIFYKFIDNDPSLQKKASRAYFNGFLWTTWADLRAISFLFLLVAALECAVNPLMGFKLLVAYGAAFGLSLIGSSAQTKRHIEIGNEQIEYIDFHYKDELRKLIQSAITGSSLTSNSTS